MSDATPTDHELVASTRGGDHAAFDVLMRRYERLVFKVAHGFTRQREEALDLTQTCFLKAYRALDGFRAEADVKTWLLRIAYHEGLNWVRSNSRRGVRAELDPEAPQLMLAPTQQARLEHRDRLGGVQRALARLNERYRLAIVLRYLDEMPIRDIAGVLACSETMTRNILFRGVRQLRRAVTDGR